jgi:hypothetical protein
VPQGSGIISGVSEIIVFRKAEDVLDRNKTSLIVIGFEVLVVVLMKSSVFWDITLSYPLRIHSSYLHHSGFLLGLFFDVEDGGNMCLQNSD